MSKIRISPKALDDSMMIESAYWPAAATSPSSPPEPIGDDVMLDRDPRFLRDGVEPYVDPKALSDVSTSMTG